VLALPRSITDVQRDPIAGEIIDAAITVHRELGPGLLESSYLACLEYELLKRGVRVERQVGVPLVYDGLKLDCGYRLDLLVDGAVIVEVKSVEYLTPIHNAQVLTYLRLTGARQALLFNFNCVRVMDGMRSFLGPGEYVPRTSKSPEAGG